MQKLKEYFPSIFLGVCLLATAFFLYKSFFKRNSLNLPAQTKINVQEVVPTKVIFPTKTPEEIKVISAAKTMTVEVTDTKIEPIALEVKAFDQVMFNNKSGKTIKIVGENWGNFPVASGLNMIQPFKKAGKFSYTVTGLGASLSGEIIVK